MFNNDRISHWCVGGRWILLLSLVTRLSLPSQAQDAREIQKSCRNFVQQFYDWYVKRPEFPRALKYRRSAFSPELSRRLTEDNEAQAKTPGYIVGLDFDPFLNGQDPGEHYVVGRIKLTGEQTCWAEIHKGSSDKMSKATYVAAELVSNVGRWHFVNFYYSLPNSDFSASVAHGGLLALLKDLRQDRRKAAKTPSNSEPTSQTKAPPSKQPAAASQPTPPK
jgi:hypothetical protein